MVGESDTLSPTFSMARTGLWWAGGFFFIFIVIAVLATLFDQPNSGSGNRSRANGSGRAGNSSRTPARSEPEPELGLTPQTGAKP